MVLVLSYEQTGFTDLYAYFAYFLSSHGLPVCEYIATGGLSGSPMGSGGIGICRSGFHGKEFGEAGLAGGVCPECSCGSGGIGWTCGFGRSRTVDSKDNCISPVRLGITSGSDTGGVGRGGEDHPSESVDGGDAHCVGGAGDQNVLNSPTQGVRGPNWARNQRARVRRREKLLRNASQCSGAVKSEEPLSDNRKGYFQDCSKDTQVELRETRAKMLIAQNNLRAIEAEKRIKSASSPVSVLEEAIAAVELANRAARASSDSKVMEWAKVVADNASERIARSAPSSSGLSYEDYLKSEKVVTASSSISTRPADEIVETVVVREDVKHSTQVTRWSDEMCEVDERSVRKPMRKIADESNRNECVIIFDKGMENHKKMVFKQTTRIGVIKAGTRVDDGRPLNIPDTFIIKESRWTGGHPGIGKSYTEEVVYKRPPLKSNKPVFKTDNRPSRDWCFSKVEANAVELRAISMGLMSSQEVERARASKGREINYYDFQNRNLGVVLQPGQLEEIEAVHRFGILNVNRI